MPLTIKQHPAKTTIGPINRNVNDCSLNKFSPKISLSTNQWIMYTPNVAGANQLSLVASHCALAGFMYRNAVNTAAE